MNRELLSQRDRILRQNVRNFLLGASLDELRRELEISQENGNQFRAECITELIEEENEYKDWIGPQEIAP